MARRPRARGNVAVAALSKPMTRSQRNQMRLRLRAQAREQEEVESLTASEEQHQHEEPAAATAEEDQEEEDQEEEGEEDEDEDEDETHLDDIEEEEEEAQGEPEEDEQEREEEAQADHQILEMQEQQERQRSLFDGLYFHLTMLVREKAYKIKIAQMIVNHGGQITTSNDPTALQLVDPDRQMPGKDWVSTSFVEDCVRLQKRLPLQNYKLPKHPRESGGIRRKGRLAYDDVDRARLIQFAEDYFRQHSKSATRLETIPESVWKRAESLKITNHSASSMHEQYRKHIQMLTPRERRAIMKNAEKVGRMSNGKSKTLDEDEVISLSEDEEDAEGVEGRLLEEEIDGRSRKRMKSATQLRTVTETSGRRTRQLQPTHEEQFVVTRHAERTTRSPKPSPPYKAVKNTTSSPSKKAMKSPRINTSQPPTQTRLLSASPSSTRRIATIPKSPTKSSLEPPLQIQVSHTPERQSVRRSLLDGASNELKEHKDLKKLKRRRHIGAEDATGELESSEMSEKEAEELISRLQFETGQDKDFIVHALYFADGAYEAARIFLMGDSPTR